MHGAEQQGGQQHSRPDPQPADQARLQQATKQQLFGQDRHAQVDCQPQPHSLRPFRLPANQAQGQGQQGDAGQGQPRHRPGPLRSSGARVGLAQPPGQQGQADQQFVP
ncbi:hypothetical protein D3C72_1544780 [compost metagenome]